VKMNVEDYTTLRLKVKVKGTASVLLSEFNI